MYKLENYIIKLSLEKNTKNTPTKDKYYLFKDGKLITSGSYKKLKMKFDEIIEENKQIIEESTKEFREKPVDNKTLFKNWMNKGSNLSFFGGTPKRAEAEKVLLKKSDKK